MKNLAYRCLASGLALLLAINTPVFARWANSCWTPVCCPPAPMVCCEPVECCPPVSCDPCGTPVVETSSDCGCTGEATVVHEDVYMPAAPSHSAETHSMEPQPTVATPPMPTEVAEPAPPAVFGGGFRSDSAKPEVAVEEAPSDDWDAGFNSAPPEPAVAEVEEPAELPASADLPMEDAEPAADDLFGSAPAEEPADDLFGAPVEEPAEEPADDLFGEAPAEEEPADDLFGAPAEEPAAPPSEEPADDLFGGAPAEESAEEEMPADDLFGAPAEEPAAEEPADDLFGEAPAEEEPADDLFGSEDEVEPADDLFGAPAEEAPAEEPADDLFGEEPAAEAPADDLFGEETPAAEEPADAADDLFGGEDDDADDLFGGEEEEAPADDEDDLFGGFGAILGEPGGIQSGRDRTWVDNTGRHSTVGRLLAIDGGAIRLAKHDGGIATVPLSRLSQADLEFVSRQAIAMSDAREWAIAHGQPIDKNAPKQARTGDELPLRTAQL